MAAAEPLRCGFAVAFALLLEIGKIINLGDYSVSVTVLLNVAS